jgi:hypothetical protein
VSSTTARTLSAAVRRAAESARDAVRRFDRDVTAAAVARSSSIVAWDAASRRNDASSAGGTFGITAARETGAVNRRRSLSEAARAGGEAHAAPTVSGVARPKPLIVMQPLSGWDEAEEAPPAAAERDAPAGAGFGRRSSVASSSRAAGAGVGAEATGSLGGSSAARLSAWSTFCCASESFVAEPETVTSLLWTTGASSPGLSTRTEMTTFVGCASVADASVAAVWSVAAS